MALINRRDQYHEQAIQLVDQMTDRTLLTTSAVLFKLGNALAGIHKTQTAALMRQFLTSNDVEIVYIDAALFEQALALSEDYSAKAWGLVDCIAAPL